MISPRRADSAIDPMLVTGLLGAAAILRALRAIVTELAEDGDRDPCGEERTGDAAGSADEIVEVVVGLAALAEKVARDLPEDHGPSVANDDGDLAREPDHEVAEDLLR